MPFLVILFSTIGIVSCTSDTLSEDIKTSGSFIFQSKFDNATNYVFISSTGAHNIFPGDGVIQTDFESNFIPFEINGIGITESNIDEDENLIPFRTGKNPNLLFLGNLGTNLEISLQGQTVEVYNPKFVNVSSESFINQELRISKTNGIEINWEADENNPNEDLFLVLINRGDRNSVTDKPDAVVSTVVKDENESFVLSPNALNGFSVGHDVDFYIARGNEILLGETAFVLYNINLIGGKIVE